MFLRRVQGAAAKNLGEGLVPTEPFFRPKPATSAKSITSPATKKNFAWGSGDPPEGRCLAVCFLRWRAMPLHGPPRAQRHFFPVIFYGLGSVFQSEGGGVVSNQSVAQSVRTQTLTLSLGAISPEPPAIV
jgi:hypothetical protein